MKKYPSYFEWIQLFISLSIPVAIVVYTVLDNNRRFAIAARNRAQDLQTADNQQKDVIFHEYQKTISKLIEKYGPQLNQSASVSLVARFETFSALNQLDPDRRNSLIHLLYNAKLINYQLVSDQPAISLETANLTELCLIDGSNRQILRHITFDSGIMNKANFHGISIHGAIFNRATLNNADFSSTSNFWFCSDVTCDKLNSATLYFEESDLISASFAGAVYENTMFSLANMTNTNLHLFQCTSCFLYFADMSQTELRNAEMKDSSFAFAILIHAKIHESIFDDFSNADISYGTVTYSNFTQSRFDYTQFRNTIIHYTIIGNSTFIRAKMFRASMQHSVFTEVNFTSADMSEGDWRHVWCERCIFNEANFNNTDLFNATFIQSDFRYTNFREEQLRQFASFKDSILPNKTAISYK